MSFTQEFLYAAKTGDADKVQQFLADFPSLVHARGDWNKRPLHYAAKDGHLDVAALLVEHGADLHATDELHRCTPLAWATVFGSLHSDLAEYLIAQGASPDIFTAVALDKTKTVQAMIRASTERACRCEFLAFMGKDRAVQALVKSDSMVLNAKMSRHDDDRQPIHLAIMKDRIGMVELLLDAGTDIHARTASGKTPLCIATEWKRHDIAELLLARGARLDLCVSLALGQPVETAYCFANVPPRYPRIRPPQRKRNLHAVGN